LDFIEGRGIIPADKITGADPYMVLYLVKNKKKVRPSRKDFTTFVGAKYTFALTKDCSKEDVKLEFYYKSKTMIGTATIPVISLLPFNTEHDKWIKITDSSKENHGEIHARLYLFPKREKTTTKSKYPTPFFKAVEECDLQLLMKCNDDPKLNPNAQDVDGWTALHHACNKWENEYLITMLLRNPAVRVDIVNVDGNTVLHTFCQKYKNPKCEEAFNMLIQHGANVNAKNSQRETPLHKAVINPRIRMILVELLIKAGAKVNESVKGGTPLHYAVQLSRTDLVTILMANGADLTVKDSRGDTPLDLCKQFKNDAVLRKLQEFQKLGEYLDSLGAGNLKRQFFQKQLFKWKLKGMTEQQMKKYGIEISAGQSLKLFAAFKEIEDTDPSKEEGAGRTEEDKESVVDPAKQRHLLDEMINKGEWKIDESALEFLQLLGTGSAGDVYKGRYTVNITEGGKTQKVTIPVAIKILKLTAGKELDAFQLEFKVISAIQSPYIVKLYGAVPSEKLKMVMEICTRGSLYGILNTQQWHIGWEEFFVFAEQMFRGLIVIHTHKPQILHRDLKSLNVLVSEDWICKLCDFGLARFDTGGNMETLSKLRGTFAYSAPEVYFGERYSDKSDIYSMGILLWEMLYRVINQEYQRPYEEFPRLKLDWQIIHKTATENLRPTIPPSTPVPLATLIRQCIVKDQAGRPDAKEVLQELSQLHAQYRHSRMEWDAAIVGTKVGQAIVFPEGSKPDLFSSTPSSSSLIPTGTTAAVAATLSSPESGEIVVEQVGDAAPTAAETSSLNTLGGAVASTSSALVGNDNAVAHGMVTASADSPSPSPSSPPVEESRKDGEEHHHHHHHHEHRGSEKPADS